MYKNQRLIIKFLIIIFFTIFIFSCDENKKIEKVNLTQRWWKYRKIGDDTWKSLPIPATIHSALQRDTIIKSLYFGKNFKDKQWIENEDYEYQLLFQADRKLISKEKIELVFEGIDTYAEIFLNDSLILTTDNMFRKWKFDCKKIIKLGNNTINVKIYSPLKKQKELLKNSKYKLLSGEQTITRKANFHFGTDYSYRFVTSGIWRTVYFIAWNNAIINNVQFYTKNITDSTANMEANIEINSSINKNSLIRISYENNILCSKKIDLKKGINNYSIDFVVNEPKLWWTHDLGEPFLYDFKTELFLNNKSLDTKKTNIGIRTIEIVQNNDSSLLKINNKPLFLKGVVYIPQDIFQDNVNKNKYKKIIRALKISNVNIIRLFEEGIYENEIFYNLCDKHGILIWHDIMLPHEIFPDNKEFTQNIETETVENILRLRNHPSIAFWFADNKIESIWKNKNLSAKYSKQDSITIWQINNEIFNKIIPNIIEKYDNERQYLTDFNIINFFENNFIKAYPIKSSISHFTPEKQFKINSEIIIEHTKYGEIDFVELVLNYFFNIDPNFESFIYLNQLMQAKQIYSEMEKSRLNRSNNYTGIFYGIVNDCCPIISSANIDYFGHWKAAQFYLKKIYNPLLFIFEENNASTKVYIVSDKHETIDAKISFKVFNFNGKTLWRKKFNQQIEANSCKNYFNLKLANVIKIHGKQNIVMKAEIIANQTIIAEQYYFFTSEKNLNLSKPKIDINFFLIENGYAIELKSDKLAKNVYITTKEEGIFEDNFFDIISGDNKVLKFYTDKNIDKIEEKFKIISFYDIVNKK